MGGGLMQLVAYGAQDIYLTGNPQITFFKVVYRRHTNFSMESVVQTFNGNVGFGNRVTCTVSRNGDLINRMYLQVSLGALTSGKAYSEWVGHQLIKSVEIEIGGQRIDKHYGDWLHIWNELSQTAGHYEGYKAMVSGVDSSMGASNNDLTLAPGAARELYIPLQFWFCRNPGLALPLIALQYHEVKINIEFASLSAVSDDTTSPDFSAELYVDYVYLDTDERRRFAQVSHEYLIEQLQFTGDEAGANSLKRNLTPRWVNTLPPTPALSSNSTLMTVSPHANPRTSNLYNPTNTTSVYQSPPPTAPTSMYTPSPSNPKSTNHLVPATCLALTTLRSNSLVAPLM